MIRFFVVCALIYVAAELPSWRVLFWGRATAVAERAAWGVSLWCSERLGDAVRAL